MDLDYFKEKREKAKKIYESQKTVFSPYLDTEVILNADGFHHLQFSARRERGKKEQLLKFSLLPLALQVVKKSATLQEYRKVMVSVGKKSKRDGFTRMKNAEFWGFVAITGRDQVKIRVILRRIGDGNINFWSVMPDAKLERAKKQKLFYKGIEDN